MNTLLRRGMRLTILTLGFAGLFVAVNAVPGAATASSGFTGTPLGHATLSRGDLLVKPGLQVVVTRNVVDPLGTSGWHSHPGGAIVVVTDGQITTYRVVRNDQEEDGNQASEASDSNKWRCAVDVYNVGDLFFERPGEPLNAKNVSTTVTAILIATFPSVPIDKATGKTLQRTDVPQPSPDPCPI